MNDLADLLGDDLDVEYILPPQPEKRRAGRPTKEEAEARRVAQEALNAPPPDATVFFQPVGVTFLANVFRKHKVTIAKKLMLCPIRGYAVHKGNQVPLYDFVEAAGFIVDPKIDLTQWIKSQRAQDLPPHINDQFWKSQLARQKWEALAGNYWLTEDVMQVFGLVGMTIKETTQSWLENMPGKETLTDAQHRFIAGAIAALLDDVFAKLTLIPQQQQTLSSAKVLDDEIRKADQAALARTPDEDEDLL